MKPSLTPRFPLPAYQFFVTGVMGFLQPFLPLYIFAAGLTPQEYGYAAAIGTATCLVVQPLLGRLSDRIDARVPFMIGAALVAGAAYSAFRVAPFGNFWVIATLLALGTNGFVYLNTVAGVLVARVAAANGEAGGTAYVRTRVWGSVGYIVIALSAGLLVRGGNLTAKPSRDTLDALFTYGPALFLLIAGIAAIVPDIAASRSVPPSPDGIAPASQDTSPLIGDTSQNAGGTPQKTGGTHTLAGGVSPNAIANRRRFLAAFVLYQIALYGASAYLPLYLAELRAAPAWLTATFAAGVVVEVLVMTQVGRWTDAHGRRPALLLSFLLLPMRLLLYIPATLPIHVLLVQTLHGLNFGIVGTIAVVFVNDTAADANRGSAQAELAGAIGLAGSVAPIVCGFLVERDGIDTMFAVMSGLAAVAALLFCAFVSESHPAPTGDFVNKLPRFLREPWFVSRGN